jgi:hypothetical protein
MTEEQMKHLVGRLVAAFDYEPSRDTLAEFLRYLRPQQHKITNAAVTRVIRTCRFRFPKVADIEQAMDDERGAYQNRQLKKNQGNIAANVDPFDVWMIKHEILTELAKADHDTYMQYCIDPGFRQAKRAEWWREYQRDREAEA